MHADHGSMVPRGSRPENSLSIKNSQGGWGTGMGALCCTHLSCPHCQGLIMPPVLGLGAPGLPWLSPYHMQGDSVLPRVCRAHPTLGTGGCRVPPVGQAPRRGADPLPEPVVWSEPCPCPVLWTHWKSLA